MENENNFKETVSSLFKGMDGFVSAKTVVGDAIHVGDTIILPLVDVSFGVGAGAFAGDKKNNGAFFSINYVLRCKYNSKCSCFE